MALSSPLGITPCVVEECSFAKVVEYWPPLSLRVCGLDSVSVHRYAKKMSLKKKKNWIARARVAQTTLPIALM